MIQCNIKKKLLQILLIGFAAGFSSCSETKIDKGKFCTAIEIEKTFGKPSSADTIILKKGMKLYEFQGELERILPQKDSLKVLQYVFYNGDFTMVIWLVPSGKEMKVIDVLKWNHNEIQY